MKKNRLHLIWILIATLFFLFLVIFSSLKIYQIALDETKRNHQLLQKEMAETTVSGIHYYLNHLSKDLKLLAISPCLRELDDANYQSLLTSFFTVHGSSSLIGILLYDLNFHIVYSLPDSISDFIPAFPSDKIREVLNVEKKSVWYSNVFLKMRHKDQQELWYLVLTPVPMSPENAAKGASLGQSIGYIGMIISFDWLLQNYVEPLSIDTNVAAWLMDGRGRLLYHPEHPEMVMKSIFENSAECAQCHASFDWQKKMIHSEAAYGEYSVGDEPVKIMSHVPLQTQNERWILVVSSDLEDVTSVLKSKFSLFLIMVVLILIFILIVAYYFYKINAKRIRAEEAQRHSEHKELLHLQVCQASKLASVGELVDSVAHEINTPIGIIMAQADAMLLKTTGDKCVFKEEIEIIKKQSQRVRYYTHRLLNYSRSMPFEPRRVNVSRLLDECLFLLAPRFRAHNINILKNVPANLPKIIADRRQIEQVFMNILNNAVDAIDSKGEIKVVAHSIQKDEAEGIEILISDDGEGITEADLEHIFDPFFSTKTPTKGTGLGLSISKAIIQRHHGKIGVVSKHGVGTTFNVFLPVNSKDGTEL